MFCRGFCIDRYNIGTTNDHFVSPDVFAKWPVARLVDRSELSRDALYEAVWEALMRPDLPNVWGSRICPGAARAHLRADRAREIGPCLGGYDKSPSDLQLGRASVTRSAPGI